MTPQIPMDDPASKTARRRDLAILAVAAAVLFIVPCGIPTLWDKHEGRFFESAREMISSGDWVVPRILGDPVIFYPPLCAWLIAVTAKLLGGFSEFAARFPSALAAVGCVLMAYEFGRRLFDRRTGLFAGLALMTIPVWPKAAIVCEPDTLVVLLLMVSLYALLRIEGAEKRRWPWAALFWTALSVNVLAKGYPGPVMTLAVAGAWILWERKWKLAWQLNPILGLAVVALLVPPWFLMAKHVAGSEYLVKMWRSSFDMAAGGELLVHKQPPLFYAQKLAGAAPWIVFALAAIIPASNDLRERSARRFLLCWAGVILLMLSVAQAKRAYYLLPIFPAVAVLAATWWTRLPPWGTFSSRWRERMPVLLVGLASAAALILPFVLADERVARMDITRGILIAIGVFAGIAGAVFCALHVSDRRRPGFFALAGLLFAALVVQQTWGARINDVRGRKGVAFCASVRPKIGPQARLVVLHVQSFVPFYLDTPFEIAGSPEEAVADAREGTFLVVAETSYESAPALMAAWEPLSDAGVDMANTILCRPRR